MSAYVKQSPITDIVEGETYVFDLTFAGNPTITGTPTIKVYNEETDTATNFLSSSNGSVSGSVITTSTFQNFKGGQIYTLSIKATVNGQVRIYLCELRPLNPWGGA